MREAEHDSTSEKSIGDSSLMEMPRMDGENGRLPIVPEVRVCYQKETESSLWFNYRKYFCFGGN